MFVINRKKILSVFIFISLFLPQALLASVDTDGDGYEDAWEIKNGYSPYNPEEVKAEDSDTDKDGLSDYWEYVFHTNPEQADSDNDGYSDYEEIDHAYDPNSGNKKRLESWIEVDREHQELTYVVSGQAWKKFSVSTGKPSMPTPAGVYKILNKSPKAWSKAYGLYMPYWLGLGKHGEFGIHELPVWPNGYREGEDHLGIAVSYGFTRLGVGAAKYIYERSAVASEVRIK